MTSKSETTPPQHIPCFDCEGYGRCTGACEQQTTAEPEGYEAELGALMCDRSPRPIS